MDLFDIRDLQWCKSKNFKTFGTLYRQNIQKILKILADCTEICITNHMHKLEDLYYRIVWYKYSSLRVWFVTPYYHKIFIFTVLERWLYDCDCETECIFVYLIFAALLRKFNQSLVDLYAFMKVFEVNSFNRSSDREGFQNFKSRSRDPFTIAFDLILHLFFVSASRVQYACHI